PDAAGKLRRVLGYRYEDFLKAWQGQDERHGESDRPPFVIADLCGTLKASGDVVQAKFSITVELQSSAWVQVPLRLASLAVEQANVEGDSDEFVTFDPKLKSFV